MKEHDKTTKITETTTLVEAEVTTQITPTQQILSPLTVLDYSQFLYATNYGGKVGQYFTAEGIKTIGLQNGISTGDVKVVGKTPF